MARRSDAIHLEVNRLALQEAPAPDGAGEFSIAHRDLAAHRHHARAAFDFQPSKAL